MAAGPRVQMLGVGGGLRWSQMPAAIWALMVGLAFDDGQTCNVPFCDSADCLLPRRTGLATPARLLYIPMPPGEGGLAWVCAPLAQVQPTQQDGEKINQISWGVRRTTFWTAIHGHFQLPRSWRSRADRGSCAGARLARDCVQ